MGPGAPAIWHTAPMADTGRSDDTDDGPSLEMPSFSLRRRKKAPPTEPIASEPAAVPEPEAVPEPAPPATPAEPVRPAAAARPVEAPTAVVPVVASEPEPEPRPRRELPTIALAGLPAAAVTGVVIGALAMLLTWLATSACDVVRGTSSCGGGPGLLILAAVLVVLAWAGSLLLRLFGVADAGSTSILAVGILTVLVLVFLLGSIDEWWMVVALPVAAVVAFCASWWVTTSVVADDSPDGTRDDR